MAKLVWTVLCAALLPVRLCDLQSTLDPFVDHIRRANERRGRPRQRDLTRAMLAPGVVG